MGSQSRSDCGGGLTTRLFPFRMAQIFKLHHYQNLMLAVSPWPAKALLYTPLYAYLLCTYCRTGSCDG